MSEKVLFSYKGLEVRVGDEASEEMTSLLADTVVGSEGGIQYIMRDIPGRIRSYGDSIRFVSLWRNFSLAALIGTCFRRVSLGGDQDNATYLRFLSFRSTYRTRKRVKRRETPDIPAKSAESFRHQALKMFSEPHLLGFPGVNENDRHVMYAYVESKNERSKQIIQQAGYEYIRSFLTVAFSRFRPCSHPSVRPATTGEYPEIRRLLRDFYHDHSFYFEDFVFQDDRYYILKEGDRIIAGASAIPTEYVIHNVPGVWGWIMMKIIPFAPGFRRLFRPDLFRFASLGSVFHLPGRGDALATLFESICAHTGHNTALTWVDDRGPLYETFRTEANMGTLNRILNAKPGLVYARFIGFSSQDKEKYLDAPVFISGFDFS